MESEVTGRSPWCPGRELPGSPSGWQGSERTIDHEFLLGLIVHAAEPAGFLLRRMDVFPAVFVQRLWSDALVHPGSVRCYLHIVMHNVWTHHLWNPRDHGRIFTSLPLAPEPLPDAVFPDLSSPALHVLLAGLQLWRTAQATESSQWCAVVRDFLLLLETWQPLSYAVSWSRDILHWARGVAYWSVGSDDHGSSVWLWCSKLPIHIHVILYQTCHWLRCTDTGKKAYADHGHDMQQEASSRSDGATTAPTRHQLIWPLVEHLGPSWR